jgi:hypothetical protein
MTITSAAAQTQAPILADAGLTDRSAEQLLDQGADAAENRLKNELENKLHVRLALLA